jgi:hypothetical protein
MWGAILSAVLGAASKAGSKKAGVDGQNTQDYGSAAKGTGETQAEPQVSSEQFKANEPMEIDSDNDDGIMGSLSDENAKDTTEPVGENKNEDAENEGGENKNEGAKNAVNLIGKLLDAAKAGAGSSNQVQPIAVGNYGAPAVSDGTLKNKEKIERLFQNDNAIKAFSDIDAYVYKYNQKAQDTYAGEKGVDDSTHFGPIAQDLAKNPVTSGAVHRDESGYLTVDTRQLALTNTAMISQLARKIEELEERIGGR